MAGHPPALAAFPAETARRAACPGAVGASVPWSRAARATALACRPRRPPSTSWPASLPEVNRPLSDQIGVDAVVLNRVASGQFPNSVRGLIFHIGPLTSVSNGHHHQPAVGATSIEAAKDALAREDPTGGALYFYDPGQGISSSWMYTQTFLDHRWHGVRGVRSRLAGGPAPCAGGAVVCPAPFPSTRGRVDVLGRPARTPARASRSPSPSATPERPGAAGNGPRPIRHRGRAPGWEHRADLVPGPPAAAGLHGLRGRPMGDGRRPRPRSLTTMRGRPSCAPGQARSVATLSPLPVGGGRGTGTRPRSVLTWRGGRAAGSVRGAEV